MIKQFKIIENIYMRLVANEKTRNRFASSSNFKGGKCMPDFLRHLKFKKEQKKNEFANICQ